MLRKLFIFTLLFSLIRTLCFGNWDQHKETTLQYLPSFGGTYNLNHIQNLMELIRMEKSDICVTTRVSEAGVIYVMASALQHKQRGFVYMINSWDDEGPKKLTSFKKKMISTGANKHCSLLKANPQKGLKKFNNNTVDIFHTYGKQGLKDAVSFLPKIREKGFISIDDIFWDASMPEVQCLLENCTVIEMLPDYLLFQKNDKP